MGKKRPADLLFRVNLPMRVSRPWRSLKPTVSPENPTPVRRLPFQICSKSRGKFPKMRQLSGGTPQKTQDLLENYSSKRVVITGIKSPKKRPSRDYSLEKSILIITIRSDGRKGCRAQGQWNG